MISRRNVAIAAVCAIVAIVVVAVLGSRAEAAPITGCHLEVFEGVVTAVDCPEGTQVATYQYPDGVAPHTGETDLPATFPQSLHDSGIGHAKVPSCAWQVDAVASDTPILGVIDANHLYGDKQVAPAVHGGDSACVPASTTSLPAETTTVPDVLPSTTVRVVATVAAPTPGTLAVTGISPAHSWGLSWTAIGLIVMGVSSVIAARQRVWLIQRR